MDESGIVINSLTSLLGYYNLFTKLNAQISGSIITMRTFNPFLQYLLIIGLIFDHESRQKFGGI